MTEQTHSPEIGELVKALAAAQAEIGEAELNSSNPHFGSKYSDLASVQRACRGPLTKAGIAVSQIPQRGSQGWELVTVLLHSSGQWLRGVMPLKAERENMQGLGSALTYARRYALASMVGVAQEDDDGERSIDRERKKLPPRVRDKPEAASKPGMISEGQRKRLWAISKGKGMKEADLRELLSAGGIESTSEIKASEYDVVIAAIENWKQSEASA